MFFTFTLDRDDQVIELIEVLDEAYSLPDSLENLRDRLEKAREAIFEATIKRLEDGDNIGGP
jgi:biotin operon repressor